MHSDQFYSGLWGGMHKVIPQKLYCKIRKDPMWRPTIDSLLEDLSKAEQELLLMKYEYGFSKKEMAEHFKVRDEEIKYTLESLLEDMGENINSIANENEGGLYEI